MLMLMRHLVILGAIVLTSSAVSCDRDSPPEDSGENCEAIDCFRPYECVSYCGGPVLYSGCCPCTSNQLDRVVDCPDCEDTPGCVEICEGGDCSCHCDPIDGDIEDGGDSDVDTDTEDLTDADAHGLGGDADNDSEPTDSDVSAYGANLVLNPGFEDDKEHWDKGTRMSVVDHDVHSGDYCLMTRQVDVDGEIDEVRQNVKGVVGGRSYVISGWVKGVNLGGPKGVRIRYYWARDGVELAPSELLFSQNGTFEYTEATDTIEAPAEANELEIIYIHYDTGTGTAYGDDFSLREVLDH